MLEYLVTSKTRRALLCLLWREKREGTVADLAEQAAVAFAGAYKELHAMEAAGLALSVWSNGRRVFRSVQDHPEQALLETLCGGAEAMSMKPQNSQSADMSKLKGELAGRGLPVNAAKSSPSDDRPLETLLASACALAHRDASVARSLPVLLARCRNELDLRNLERACRAVGQKHTMGFFLELTAQLSGDKALSDAASCFRDKRRNRDRQFFDDASAFSRRMAKRRSPDLAKKWHLLMNLSYESFASTFEKFRNDSLPVH